jgi:hypothetical protein
MKLRNKKTGEVADLSIFGIELNIRKENQPIYYSLADLNEEWEDYKPAEPYIKDEEIRKAVRAWYNILPRLEDKQIVYNTGVLWVGVYSFDCGQYDILDVWLRDGEHYTIDELCGEEEE